MVDQAVWAIHGSKMNCVPRFTPRILLEVSKRLVPVVELMDLFSSGSQAVARLVRVVRVASLVIMPIFVRIWGLGWMVNERFRRISSDINTSFAVFLLDTGASMDQPTSDPARLRIRGIFPV